MKFRNRSARFPMAAFVATLLFVNGAVYAEPTSIANGPLANAGSSAKPNITFILDDSGSMQQDATPDYVQDTQLCRASRDNTSSTFDLCRLGDPPYMNSEFNFQYYNPKIRYQPAVNFDGTPRTSYSDPTSVSTDPFGVRNWNQFYSYGQVATTNLITQYPDRVWCDSASASNTSSTCSRNGVGGNPGYQYPIPGGRGFSRDTGFNGRCNGGFPGDSPPGPDYVCSSSQGTTVAFPKYVFGAPYYYNLVPTEHCTNANLTSCVYSATPTTVAGVTYNTPALVRWCSDTALTACQAKKTGTFRYSSLARSASPASGTIVVGGGNNTTSVTSVKVNGVEIMGGSTSGSSNRNTIASRIRDEINGFNSTPNYTATSNNETVTIFAAPGASAAGFVVTVTNSGSRNLTPSPFIGGTLIADFRRVDIIPSVTSYPKSPARADCAGSTCNYAEEITNFGNWYAYYRTRMNMTKSALGRAFAAIDDSYRAGFITINPGSPVQSSRFLAVNDFVLGNGLQKDQWFSKVYGTGFNGSTPLREALSRVGRYYANVTGGINNGMGASPMQIACQQNFAILSTDGYWNGNAGQDLSGNSVGNRDNVLGSGVGQVLRPLYDGGGSSASNTLADVAAYYYATDLRTDLDNVVPVTPKDNAPHQHMTTFTIGLGLAGTLDYESNYETSTTGDYYRLTTGALNWPVPSANAETALDDLWHAAVNGRGQFFSARNPQEVVDGVGSALSSVQIRIGAGAAAATSNLQPAAGDNEVFTAEYTTVQWIGDVKGRNIDLNTGKIITTGGPNNDGVQWEAAAQLESRAHATRSIFLGTTDTGTYPRKLKPFTYANLTAAEQAWFDPGQLGQSSGWSVGQTATATGSNLVDFLRGDKSLYDTGAVPALDTDLYRNRVRKLGDIINAQPGFLRSTPLTYNNDPGFSAFAACTQGGGASGCPANLGATQRQGTVFVGSNDGMMHAFDTGATGGQERWAYIPSILGPKLYQLANRNYTHTYYVDGSPLIADICIAADCKVLTLTATAWRTILFGGLNSGGRGFYALDVTNPATNEVKLLWEFKVRTSGACAATTAAAVGASDDCDLGLSYSQPVVTKRVSDGKWVVMVTSGYNNFNPGDGKGYLYVLDAANGTILNKIALAASGGGTPGTAVPITCVPVTVIPTYSYCNADTVGMSKIAIQRDGDNPGNNTAIAAFVGDQKGRLWRFDLTSATNNYPVGFLVTTFTDPGGTAQPITVRPEVGLVRSVPSAPPSIPAVFVGTGRYLGNADPSSTQQQTMYGIRVDQTTTIANPRATLTRQTLGADVAVGIGEIRKITSTATVDWTTNFGWFIDLPVTGERVNVDPALQVGTLVVPSNVPSTSSCTAGGFGYANFVSSQNGSTLTTAPDGAASIKLSASLPVGVNTVKLPGDKLKSIITLSNNQQLTLDVPISPPGFGGRRVTWRELIAE